MPILLSLIAALFWGFSDFAGGLGASKESGACVTASREVVEGAIVAVLVVFVGGHLTQKDLVLSIGIGLVAAISLPLFFKALANGAMAVVAPVAGVTAAFVPVVVGLATGDHPSPWQLIGIAAAFVGIALVSLEQQSESNRPSGLRLGEDVGLAVVIGLLFGVAAVMTRYTTKGSTIYPSLVISLTLLVVMLAYGVITKSRLIPMRSSLPVLVGGAVLDLTAFICFIYAVRSGLLSITGVIAAAYPAVTVLCAAVILKEHLSRPRRVGLVVSLAALGLLSIS